MDGLTIRSQRILAWARWLLMSAAIGVAVGVHAESSLAASSSSKPASATSTPASASPALRKAWDGYYAALDEMRAAMENTSIFENPQNRAKAYHTLMEMQAMAYNFVIAPRMTNPRIHFNTGWQTDIYTLGQNGPDFHYAELFLDGSQTYRLKGRMGDIKLFLIQVQNNLPGEPGNKTIGNYDLANMDVAKDGTFEIIIGGPKRAGNWVALDPKSKYNFLQFRRVLLHWGHDDIGDIQIDRISSLPESYYDYDEFDEAAMAERIHRAELFIRYLTKNFNIGLYDLYMAGTKNTKNAMSLLPGTTTSSVGSPSSKYAMGIFSLNDDEALIVELDKAPDGAYWSFQTGDAWSRSLNFNERQTSINNGQAKIDADGHLRVVISKKDPGVTNWLDTAGRHEGTIVFRNYRAETAVVPKVRKIKFDDVAANLPPETQKVTPDERKTALEYRRQGFLKLYGE